MTVNAIVRHELMMIGSIIESGSAIPRVDIQYISGPLMIWAIINLMVRFSLLGQRLGLVARDWIDF